VKAVRQAVYGVVADIVAALLYNLEIAENFRQYGNGTGTFGSWKTITVIMEPVAIL
jgi:hypothetical protein